MKKRNLLNYFSGNLLTVLGVVLIWRGIWYVLDELDIILFGGSHLWSSILGVIVGFLILYLPDKDLKEIEKL